MNQVVHLAVHFYFAVNLVGRQWLDDGREEIDLYVPVFLVFEFLFYVGWLNVAAALYNPFGEDDDDFAVMGLMNRHIKVCMQIVDDDKDDIPEVQEDEFWKPPPGASLAPFFSRLALNEFLGSENLNLLCCILNAVFCI